MEKSVRRAGSSIVVGASIQHREQQQRAARARQAIRDWDAQWGPAPLRVGASDRVVGVWSRASVRRMRLRLAGLDYEPIFGRGRGALITLTLPGDWLPLTPTGQHWAAAWRRFSERHRRAWGALCCVWVVEYQQGRRGAVRRAPHCHMIAEIPTGQAYVGRGARRRLVDYPEWLAVSWSEALRVPPGRGRDAHLVHGTHISMMTNDGREASRVAAYFSGYASGKGYKGQRIPPDEWQEPGKGLTRVWGIRGLSEADPVEMVLGDGEEGAQTWALRYLRRWFRANFPGHRWPGNASGAGLVLGDRTEAVYSDLCRALDVCVSGDGLEGTYKRIPRDTVPLNAKTPPLILATG